MKKILYFVAAAVMMAACSDQNDVVNDLVDATKDRDIVKSFPYTLTDADYKSISDAAVKAAGDNAANKALAQAVGTDKALNSYATAAKFFPELLAKKYLALDVTSAIQVTYGYRENYLAELSTEPATTIASENFDTGYKYKDPIDKNGWSQFNTTGQRQWLAGDNAGNFFTEVTAFGDAKAEENAFLVSPEIDLAGLESPQLSFAVELRYPVKGQNYLRVLITEAYNSASPASTAWTDITSGFALPSPDNGNVALASVGSYSLAAYKGKVRIAFEYMGSDLAPVSLTTTLRLDSFRVADGDASITPVEGAVYIKTDGKWGVYADGVALTAADINAMGLTELTAKEAPNYLPAFLAGKFPYAQEKDRKAVLYGARADEYYYSGGKWTPSVAAGGRRTEQYVLSEKGWVFDPTIVYEFNTADDYQMVVDYVLDDPATSMFTGKNSTTGAIYTNEEWYYGFSANYRNVSFRLSYRGPDTSSYEFDTELQALKTDAEKVTLLWDRLEQKGLPLLLSLKFPNTPLAVDGVTQMYKVIVLMYGYDGVSSDPAGRMYEFTYKVTKAGPEPEFEFVSRTPDRPTLQ